MVYADANIVFLDQPFPSTYIYTRAQIVFKFCRKREKCFLQMLTCDMVMVLSDTAQKQVSSDYNVFFCWVFPDNVAYEDVFIFTNYV